MAYTYLNRRKDNDSIFYVGKGSGNRAFSKKDRNVYWQRTAAKYGYYSEIIMDCLTDEEAFELEELVCETIGMNNLTNLAPPGLGGVGGMKAWNKGTNGLSTGGAPKGNTNRKNTGVLTEFAKEHNISLRTIQRWSKKGSKPTSKQPYRIKVYNKLINKLDGTN